MAAAIEAYEVQEDAERQHFLATAHGGRPQARHQIGRAIDLKLRGVGYRLTVAQLGPDRFRVGCRRRRRIRDRSDARIERLDGYASRLEVGDQRFRLVSATHGTVNLIEVDGTTHRVTRDEGGVLRSPAPALVVAVPVAVGDEVAAGAPVLVLESMKMETVLTAPFPARVRELLVGTGGQVETGMPMIRLEPIGGRRPRRRPPRDRRRSWNCPADAATPAAVRAARLPARPARPAARLRPGTTPAQTLADYQRLRAELGRAGRTRWPAEIALFTAFADLCELGRNRPGGEEPAGDRVHSPREYFHSYLHSLDLDREQLPGLVPRTG